MPSFSIPLALAATIAVILGLVFLNQGGVFHRSHGNALAQDVISSHVHSLLATHLLDVPSTDQHTVKPWFDGKLKFSPPVHDFAERGFRLTAGRLDYLNGREVSSTRLPTQTAWIGNPAGPDLFIILLIVLVLFGAKKLPDLARSLGQSMNEFRKAREEIDRELHNAGTESSRLQPCPSTQKVTPSRNASAGDPDTPLRPLQHL